MTSVVRSFNRTVRLTGSTSVGGCSRSPTIVMSSCTYRKRHCHWKAVTSTRTSGWSLSFVTRFWVTTLTLKRTTTMSRGTAV